MGRRSRRGLAALAIVLITIVAVGVILYVAAHTIREVQQVGERVKAEVFAEHEWIFITREPNGLKLYSWWYASTKFLVTWYDIPPGKVGDVITALSAAGIPFHLVTPETTGAIPEGPGTVIVVASSSDLRKASGRVIEINERPWKVPMYVVDFMPANYTPIMAEVLNLSSRTCFITSLNHIFCNSTVPVRVEEVFNNETLGIGVGSASSVTAPSSLVNLTVTNVYFHYRYPWFINHPDYVGADRGKPVGWPQEIPVLVTYRNVTASSGSAALNITAYAIPFTATLSIDSSGKVLEARVNGVPVGVTMIKFWDGPVTYTAEEGGTLPWPSYYSYLYVGGVYVGSVMTPTFSKTVHGTAYVALAKGGNVSVGAFTLLVRWRDDHVYLEELRSGRTLTKFPWEIHGQLVNDSGTWVWRFSETKLFERSTYPYTYYYRTVELEVSDAMLGNPAPYSNYTVSGNSTTAVLASLALGRYVTETGWEPAPVPVKTQNLTLVPVGYDEGLVLAAAALVPPYSLDPLAYYTASTDTYVRDDVRCWRPVANILMVKTPWGYEYSKPATTYPALTLPTGLQAGTYYKYLGTAYRAAINSINAWGTTNYGQ